MQGRAATVPGFGPDIGMHLLRPSVPLWCIYNLQAVFAQLRPKLATLFLNKKQNRAMLTGCRFNKTGYFAATNPFADPPARP